MRRPSPKSKACARRSKICRRLHRPGESVFDPRLSLSGRIDAPLGPRSHSGSGSCRLRRLTLVESSADTHRSESAGKACALASVKTYLALRRTGGGHRRFRSGRDMLRCADIAYRAGQMPRAKSRKLICPGGRMPVSSAAVEAGSCWKRPSNCAAPAQAGRSRGFRMTPEPPTLLDELVRGRIGARGADPRRAALPGASD